MGEIGGSGTNIYNGIISEEYQQDLVFPKGFDVYDEMRKGDGTVRAVLLICKLPILGANYFFEPADKSTKALEIKEFCETAFFKRINWRNFIRHVLYSFDFGFIIFEKVYLLESEKYWYGKLAPRLPKSIRKWLPELEDNGTPGVEQYLYSDFGRIGTVRIPGEKLVLFNVDQEGDNYEGVSLLRSAYKHWKIKFATEKFQSMAAERNSMGIPVARQTELALNTDISDISRIEDTLRNIRAHEESFLIESPGWEYRFENPESNFDFLGMIAYHDRQISKSVLAQFLETGAGANKGGYSQNKVDQEIFLQAVSSYADGIVEVINNRLVRDLVQMNYGDVSLAPTLKYSGIERNDIESMAESIKGLAEAGVITKNIETENFVRRLLELPEISKTEYNIKKKENLKSDKNNIKLSENKFGRDFTEAEKRANFLKYNKNLKKIEIDFDEILKKHGQIAVDHVFRRSKVLVKTGKMPKASKEELVAKKEMKKDVKKSLLFGYRYGVTTATSELKKSKRIKTSPEIKNIIGIQANEAVEDLYDSLETEASFVYSSGVQKSVGEKALAGAIYQALVSKQEVKSRAFSSVGIGGVVQTGIGTVYDNFASEIWGYQYSAVLDNRTTNLCLSLDGRVVQKRGELPQPPLHAGCRSRIVAILLDQEEKPAINPPPKRIMKYVSVNPFNTTQPPKATNKKGRAKDVIDSKP